MKRVRDTAGEGVGVSEIEAPDDMTEALGLLEELADGRETPETSSLRETPETSSVENGDQERERTLRAVGKAARARARAEETLQETVRAARASDFSLREIAKVAGVSYDTVNRWTKD